MTTFISYLPYIQIVLAIFLVATILIQKSESGAGGVFGGGDNSSGVHTRRGFEKTIFNTTIILATLFALTSLLALLLK
jgi:preprotein translocase subunit SecG